jgi:hypothetical protein
VCCAAQRFLRQIIYEPHPARARRISAWTKFDSEKRRARAPVFLGYIVRDQLARKVELPSPVQGV